MGLISRADSDAVVRDAIVLDLGDLNRQAKAIRDRASEEAESILSDAQEERARIMSGIEDEARQAGHKSGHQAGLEEGREAGRTEAREERGQQLDELTQKWIVALDEFEARRADFIEDTRRDLIAFVATIASRVTRKLVELDDQAVNRQLDDALALVLDPSRLVVTIHPEDKKSAEDAMPALLARFAGSTHAEIVASDTVARGSCIIRTEHGILDASIDQQIDRIVRSLTGEQADTSEQPGTGDRSAA